MNSITAPANRLLTAQEVREVTGMSYEKALALVKAHGFKIGKRYYRITVARLNAALNEGGSA